MTFNTGNPIGSTDARDRSDNSENLDLAVNSLALTFEDRLGVTRDTLEGIYQKSAYYRAGTFDAGYTLTNNRQTLAYGNVEYSWSGTFPKVVAAGSTPATAGGVGVGAWVDRTDLMLRNDLASIGGDALVAFQQPVDGSLPLTVHDKLSQILSALDFASGDGEKDDTGAFLLFEQFVTGRDVDLVGKTYRVSSVPAGNNYFNGIWHTDNAEIEAINRGSIVAAAGRMAVGSEALKSLSPGYDVGSNGNVVAVGPRAMAKMIDVKTSIAMGAGAMSEGQRSRDNIAIGDDALHFVESASADYVQLNPGGTRNIAIGGNAGRFLTDGYANVTMGRNAGQNAVHTFGLVAIGNGAHASLCPIGLSGKIENWAPAGTSIDKTYYTVAIGNNAASVTSSEYVLALGGAALNQVKRSGSNVGVGPNALRRLEEHLWIDGRPKFTKDIDGTYSQAGNVLTFNFTDHGAVAGDTVTLRLLDGDSKTFQQDKAPAVVTAVSNANQFTVNHPVSRSASGAAHLYDVVHGDVDASNTGNTAVGAEAGAFVQRGSNNTATGFGALFSVQDSHPAENTADGYQSLYKINNGMGNVAIGFRASYELINGTYNTTIGYSAGRNSVAGGQMQNFNNVTCVGSWSRISADNQVQLGDSLTTTYVYGTVQNRSDARDKADIRDTELGIEFIMGLRPVDGRWDMRDDYTEECQVQVGIDENAEPVFETRLRHLPKDGSRARTRKHHWFIAQEVKELCDKLGVDFGGYQDHSINGGCDVLSLGYDEFIPPTVKAVQQCWARLGELENRITKLELK